MDVFTNTVALNVIGCRTGRPVNSLHVSPIGVLTFSLLSACYPYIVKYIVI